jgi:autotransporter-associated beta strand protein
MPTPRLLLFLAALCAATSTSAQTWTGAVSTAWDDANNWNPAVVPDNGATAVFTADGLTPTAPGSGQTNDLTITGSHSLASLQILAGAPSVDLYLNNTAGDAALTFTGQGLQNGSGVTQSIRLGDFNLGNPHTATLTFTNDAAADDFRLFGIGDNLHLEFRGHASAGSAYLAAYNVDFFDDATAGNSRLNVFSATTITFHDRSTTGAAQFDANFYGNIVFADASSAGGVRIARSATSTTSGSMVFRDQSSAASADLTLYNVAFQDSASAGSAKLNNLGFQQYSSHGEYVSAFANLVFRDHATADHAAIENNAMGFLGFSGASTAGHAVIANTGTVTFSGQSAFGDAQLKADSGSYLVNAGYNQTAQPRATGGVLFTDQATGGNGSIKIASAGAWLDFSGLATGTGTTGRAALPAAPTGDVVPDDAGTISFGSIGNTVAGGNIYLGGTTLRVGSDNTDATLSARLSDVGGAYGSAAGARLHGGTLVKTGTGTLAIANPDNSYGATLISAGALRLDGGRIGNATVTAGARLTGNGTVQGSLQNAGLVSPGNSPGTITVQGDFTQTAAGTLAIEFAAPTSYDHLAVSGTATLGGTLQLTGLAGFVPVGSGQLDFLTAAAVTGQFDTITGLPGGGTALSTQLVYSPTGVGLQVTQHPFAGFGGASPAGTALGGHLDATLANSAGDYRDLAARLNTLSGSSAIATALEALAPDRYAALAENSFLAATTQQSARDRRLAALRPGTGHGFDLWFDVGQRRTRFDAAPGLPVASAALSGGTATGAWHNDGFALGVAVGQEDGDIDLDAAGSRGDLKSTIPAVFFQYAADRWFVNASAAFSRDDYEVRRHVAFAGFDQTAAATASGKRNDFGVNVGARFRAATWSLTPQAGVLASRWQLDGFAETGAAGANLALADQSLRSLRTRVGFEAAASGDRFTPRLSVYWLHETGDDRTVQAGFAGAGGVMYAAPGRPAAANLVQASVGCDCRLGRHAVLNLTAAGAWGDAARVTSDLSAGFRWEF